MCPKGIEKLAMVRLPRLSEAFLLFLCRVRTTIRVDADHGLSGSKRIETD